MSQRTIKKEVSTADYTLWVSTEGRWQELASNKYYDQPTQVMFGVDEGEGIRSLAGIAYHDYVICLECGEVIPLRSGQFDHGFKELSWVSLSDECLGDEFLDEEVQKMPSDFKNKTQVKVRFVCGEYRHGFFTKSFDPIFTDEDIARLLKIEYCEWAKEVCKSYVPQALIDRFDDMIEEYGLTDEELHWEKIYMEE